MYHCLLSGGELGGRGWVPAELGRLTIPQLLCLLNERPPGTSPRMTSSTDWQNYLDEREAERRRWRGED